MGVLRSTVLIDAPVQTVAAALREVRTWGKAVAEAGGRLQVTAGSELLVLGDELKCLLPLLPAQRLRVDAVDEHGLSLVTPDGGGFSIRVNDTGGGVLVTESLSWHNPLGKLGDILMFRRVVLRLLAAHRTQVELRSLELAAEKIVVAAAVVREGRVLVQQRSFPQSLAGKWELPGGRVEPGETEAEALVRECEEEMGVIVTPFGRLGPDIPLPGVGLLRTHTARLSDPDAVPRAKEHFAVRWISAHELAGLDWVPADRVLVPGLLALTEEVTADR
ncbi:8-oxo-dGTP diphosphatase [Crossiella equi]|uniref:8-oxo-dGTP diphosphatase n=1 Tax=Crossiella equi TaxID=130796 RepID=A0ABS5AJK6_9PSEU|nr:(deoxy)nucleoside triphosphate pyrophosphohydrolase [Crossiella equi]MBP2476432.1 8-oxo-dGTP diphosphatase [Crossiella equi]